MGHQLFLDDPFESSISSLEAADIFSAGQLPSSQWQGLDDLVDDPFSAGQLSSSQWQGLDDLVDDPFSAGQLPSSQWQGLDDLVDDPFSAGQLSSSQWQGLDDPFSAGQLPSPQWQGLDDLDDDIHELSLPAGANATSSGGGGSGSHRKISHNAYERDRRKQVNELYSSLRSLLPDADHTKKLSIPITVSRVLKYIPELQKQVENLEKKKEELTRANCKPGVLLGARGSTAPIVSATCLDDKEIMVHVSLLSTMAAALPQSKCIKLLENEGLQLISSSTFSTFENRTFYSFHLKRTQRTMDKECPAFCDELEKIIKRKAGLHLYVKLA